MPPELHSIVITLLPILLGLGGFVVKTMLSRIETLEKQIPFFSKEPQVRQILADKLDPIKEDLQEIKSSINRLFQLYYDQLSDKPKRDQRDQHD